MVVQSRPSDPAREDEYNAWYSGTHLADVCAVPGFVRARRYKVRDAANPSGHAYLAVYEIESDDLDATVAELSVRAGDGRLPMSDALQLDPPPTVAVYELLD
ncbi:hypothetical protein EDD29_2548 [Actinocorallia herbida]|uniref:Uncharacterized protein n=2 Tax=Actinocorallia herbida TaxID=58109 RepID=A0A3N1CUN3_9ACTN|nr:hypothetical protein EDD29_2548 [Actinocorallia herbida]